METEWPLLFCAFTRRFLGATSSTTARQSPLLAARKREPLDWARTRFALACLRLFS
uniref:Uncharacterized protein n=1 Tax=Arundo donax TaxID=35708 RepID=A0A0A9D2V1_ARUDO